jgi:ABC-type molybdenum transport system ATPase subunit/photorepair protein PhrA/GNAT superfamily N-acetyltransferase
MPHAKIVLESPIESSFRVEQVRGMFDVPAKDLVRHEWDVNLPLEGHPWQLGLIVGPSGSGKTTLGRRLFPDALFHQGYQWPRTAAIVDAFAAALKCQEVTQALSSVGFSSPPHWLKRYEHLSNGQRFRCELARVMLEDADLVVFDEFTSVVDREAAKVSSAAVAKALRRRGRPKLVALSCHYDVIDWLDPDWVYNLADGSFARRSLRRRPPIELRIHPADARAWPLFRGHHYLSAHLARFARCFVATWQDNPVAFTSYVHQPGINRKQKREHRTVVLPDFQGVGIGNALSAWLAAHLTAQGWRFLSTTSHPAMIRHRLKDRRWRMIRGPSHCCRNRVDANKGKSRRVASSSTGRLTASFEWVG